MIALLRGAEVSNLSMHTKLDAHTAQHTKWKKQIKSKFKVESKTRRKFEDLRKMNTSVKPALFKLHPSVHSQVKTVENSVHRLNRWSRKKTTSVHSHQGVLETCTHRLNRRSSPVSVGAFLQRPVFFSSTSRSWTHWLNRRVQMWTSVHSQRLVWERQFTLTG